MSGGRHSQRKGRGAEIELAQFLREHGLPDARPGAPLNYGTEADVVGLPKVHIECKRAEALRLNEWYRQAQLDAQRMGGVPAVIFRQNRRPWMITLSLEDFLSLAGKELNASDGKNPC